MKQIKMNKFGVSQFVPEKMVSLYEERGFSVLDETPVKDERQELVDYIEEKGLDINVASNWKIDTIKAKIEEAEKVSE